MPFRQIMWIQEEPELTGWETRPEQVEEVMIGDVEYEVSKATCSGRVSHPVSSGSSWIHIVFTLHSFSA
jgi:hypothetical protein